MARNDPSEPVRRAADAALRRSLRDDGASGDGGSQ
jgi:hypothetical protein